jgi:choline dehydrogenase-like flavoprotein
MRLTQTDVLMIGPGSSSRAARLARGLKVLMLEKGRHIDPSKDFGRLRTRATWCGTSVCLGQHLNLTYAQALGGVEVLRMVAPRAPSAVLSAGSDGVCGRPASGAARPLL